MYEDGTVDGGDVGAQLVAADEPLDGGLHGVACQRDDLAAVQVKSPADSVDAQHAGRRLVSSFAATGRIRH
jgi:hypothetical protein